MFIRASSTTIPTHTLTKATDSASLKPQALDRVESSVAFLSPGELDFHRQGRRFKDLERFKRNVGSQDIRQNDLGELVNSFPGRNGYQEKFLGKPLSLDKVAGSRKDELVSLTGKPGETELTYTNFSVLMHKERRQPLLTAVNIDGAKVVSVPRKGKWTIDGRIPRDAQLGNEAYKGNPIDRGHMVRRRDPVWGPNPDRASNDTFAFTNAGLQHGSLNQKTWLDLENYILEQAQERDQKLTVMTGPVFSADDPSFDNRGRMDKPTPIPQEFWKVVVWNDSEEGLKGAAFIQSQKDYLGRGLFKTDFSPGEMSVYQMPLDDLEKVTGLDFSDIGDTSSGTRVLRSGREAEIAA